MTIQATTIEARRLLNAPFVGAVITTAAAGHQEAVGEGLPLFYGYLIPPLVLHADTRNALPITLATRLLAWSERNGPLVGTVQRHVKELAPYTSGGLLASLVCDLAALTPDARVVATDVSKLQSYAKRSTKEVDSIFKKASFVGKWLGSAGTPATVFTALGVRLER